MDEKKFEKQLKQEGFRVTYTWEDRPGTYHSNHIHPLTTAHIILDGTMTLVVKGTSHELNPGDRFDVPESTVHSARVGPKGCRYLIGEK